MTLRSLGLVVTCAEPFTGSQNELLGSSSRRLIMAPLLATRVCYFGASIFPITTSSKVLLPCREIGV
jgi:hypothetical protein